MAQITEDYVDSLEDIYRDVLAVYPELDPARKKGNGLAFQSIYVALDEKYTLGEIKAACEEMEKGGAMKIRNSIFAYPTELGEEIIAKLTGATAAIANIKPFVPPKP